MKNQVFYPALSAILSGIILSIFAYFAFPKEPDDYTKNISIIHFQHVVKSETILDLINNFSHGAKANDLADDVKFWGEGGKDYYLSFYMIENTGKLKVDDFKVYFDKKELAYIYDKDRFIRVKQNSRQLDTYIMPKEKTYVVIISEFRGFDAPDKFLMGKINIPVKSMTSDLEFHYDAISPWFDPTILAKDHPIVYFGVFGAGITSIFLFLTGFILTLFLYSNPIIFSNYKEVDDYARSLALLSIVKREAPEKYASAIKRAEQFYAKWAKKDSDEQT